LPPRALPPSPTGAARAGWQSETMKKTSLKIGLVALALVALVATPLASAHVIVLVQDNNDDGDCTDPGEYYEIPTDQTHGWIWLDEECAPGQA
jgi:hypothetical protein